MFGIEKRCADMIGGSGNVSKASAHNSDLEGSRKPRIYASSREFWKLLENAGTWAGAVGANQKLLEYAGELGSATWLAGTVAGTVAAYVSRGYQINLGKSWQFAGTI